MLPDQQYRKSDRLCPNCQTAIPTPFYQCHDVPVHCLQLITTRDEAVNYGRQNLDLAICDACGFVTNTSFDAEALRYDDKPDTYEESQDCSPTFRAFSQRLAKRLVDTYQLKGGSAVEIGCGKGGFVLDLVRSGVGEAIGFDPAYTPGRLHDSALEQIEFRRRFFDEQTPPLDVNLYCCRHTLEHIPDTLAFLKTIRKNIGERREPIVFIEVPDVTRILKEGAFWDIFYEHCSYFSRASLACTFRRAGLEVIESWLDFNDQYLMMVGRAASLTNHDWQADGQELLEIETLRRQFETIVADRIATHRDFINDHAARSENVVIWGSGSKCVGFLSALGQESSNGINCVVDISPYRQGYFMPGLPQKIVAPEELVERRPSAVIIMNPVYENEIKSCLHGMGLDPKIVAL